MKAFALFGYHNKEEGFVSLTGSDQYLPLDARHNLQNHIIAAEAHVIRMVRVQPYISAFQICSGDLKFYSVKHARTYKLNQVLKRQMDAALKDLDREPFDSCAFNRLRQAVQNYEKLFEVLEKHTL